MPSLTDLNDWLDTQQGENTLWYVKRLSGNDTLANETHQAGPYIPREFMFRVFPSVNRPDLENPDKNFILRIDSHGEAREVRVVWYNNRLRGGTRNESRITNLGGSSSALLDPENTGALTIFSFPVAEDGEARACNVWVCKSAIEEEIVEALVGTIDPGESFILNLTSVKTSAVAERTTCWLDSSRLPAGWATTFPSGRDLIRKTVELKRGLGLSIDDRLIARRKCEFELFKSVENAVELREVSVGFSSVEEFVRKANSILQRRKSRSGKSLELHVLEILLEEGLTEGTHFQYQPESENGERPDFLFPSETEYKNAAFPVDKLRMLGIKTTLKDRWSQVVKEAARVQSKHLLTLQEGLSLSQFRAIQEAKIKLVVPASLVRAYHEDIQPELITLESFVREIKSLYA